MSNSGNGTANTGERLVLDRCWFYVRTLIQETALECQKHDADKHSDNYERTLCGLKLPGNWSVMSFHL